MGPQLSWPQNSTQVAPIFFTYLPSSKKICVVQLFPLLICQNIKQEAQSLKQRVHPLCYAF